MYLRLKKCSLALYPILPQNKIYAKISPVAYTIIIQPRLMCVNNVVHLEMPIAFKVTRWYMYKNKAMYSYSEQHCFF